MENKILLLNQKEEYTFTKFPTMEEIAFVKQTYPNLKTIIFKNCTIPDFSSIQSLNYLILRFHNCKIENQTKPIHLKCNMLEFNNTILDFQKLFFMTDMPNLKDIRLFYDSLEGILLYKPYLPLLRFFPSIQRIRILCHVTSEKLFYDLNQEKRFPTSSYTNSNFPLLEEADLSNSFDFINFMPNFKIKSFDGITYVVSPDQISEFYKRKLILRKLWINPKYFSYYSTLQYHQDEKVKKLLQNISKLPRTYKEKLGLDFLQYDFSKMQSAYPDLLEIIKNNLRCSRLNVSTKLENEEPEKSSLYGLFNYQLYNTRGHYILVNHLGNIIYDKFENPKTKKL